MYYNDDGVPTAAHMAGTFPTLPLVTFSRAARRQIAYKGKNRLVLDGGELCGGIALYEEVLRWLNLAYTIEVPGQPFPPLQPSDCRSVRNSPLACLNLHRALLAFDLTSRAQQTWIRQAMWESSNSDTMPDPNWVYEVWAELSVYDPQYMEKTIEAAATAWKREILTREHVDAIRQIAKENPDLFDLLDRAADAVHWAGYLDWLISEERSEMSSQHSEAREDQCSGYQRDQGEEEGGQAASPPSSSAHPSTSRHP